MRQRSLRFSTVVLSLLVMSILALTAAPALAKKPKKTEGRSRES
jgi:hypothetical protein